MERKTTPITIVEQGCIRIEREHALVHREAAGIVCLYLDLASKNAELADANAGDEFPRATFAAGEHTAFLDESHPKDSFTIVEFPAYPGWDVFATTGPGRYTFGIVLIAPEQEDA